MEDALAPGRFPRGDAFSVPAAIAGAYAMAALLATSLAHHGTEVLLGWIG